VSSTELTMEQIVRPRHCDVQGMVHASRYQEFCEDAFLDWLEDFALPYRALRTDGLNLVVSDSRFAYRRPARLDDRLLVAVSVVGVNDSTIRARFDISRDTIAIADIEISYVAVRDGYRCQLPAVLTGLAPADMVSAESLLDALHRAQADLYINDQDAALRELLAPDVVWRVPGNSRISGVYEGVTQVLNYMRHRGTIANRTFRMERREVLEGPYHLAALTEGTVQREGTTFKWRTIGLYQTREGRITECQLIPFDAAAFDAAWA
jgi:acyl-CoA thioester hydrolase